MAYGVAARMGLTRKKKRSSALVAKVRRTKIEAYGSDWSVISAAVIARDGCCTSCDSVMNLRAHHIIPVCMGGSTVMSNLKTVCSRCHSKQPHHSHLR